MASTRFFEVTAVALCFLLFCGNCEGRWWRWYRPIKRPRPVPPVWNVIGGGCSTNLDTRSTNECSRGAVECSDAFIKEMEERYLRLAANCSHQAVFALSYLRDMQILNYKLHFPDTFQDPSFVRHYHALLAREYFQAQDSCLSTDPTVQAQNCSKPWHIAFDAASRKQVTVAGNLLLGMNAHALDFSLVLHKVLASSPDNGASRKADYDKVDEVCAAGSGGRVAELLCRFEDSPNLPFMGPPVDFSALKRVAWRNAQRLLSVKSDEERQAVLLELEDQAENTALQILATSTLGRMPDSPIDAHERDAHCLATANNPDCDAFSIASPITPYAMVVGQRSD